MESTKKPEEGKISDSPPSTLSSSPDEVVVSLSGAGDLLDVRFKVDPKMRIPGPIHIQDEATGKFCKVANVPKIGVLMSGSKELKRRGKAPPSGYGFGIFLNMEQIVKQGSLVTFVHGGYKKEHLSVY
jgi:hypothetical protein